MGCVSLKPCHRETAWLQDRVVVTGDLVSAWLDLDVLCVSGAFWTPVALHRFRPSEKSGPRWVDGWTDGWTFLTLGTPGRRSVVGRPHCHTRVCLVPCALPFPNPAGRCVSFPASHTHVPGLTLRLAKSRSRKMEGVSSRGKEGVAWTRLRPWQFSATSLH